MADDKPTPASPRGQAWRSAAGPVGAAPSAGSGRTGRLVIFGFLFLALLGVFVGFLFWIMPPDDPYLLTLAISEYSDPLLPPSPFARQDSEALEQHFNAAHRKNAYTSQERALLLKELTDLAATKHKHLVVHLRAHALSRGDKVYLLPSDARADDPNSWVLLTDILDKIQACQAKNKLLLLDLFGPIADARLGQLDDDLAGKVQPILDARAEKDLLIVCACSNNQLSLVSEELQRSVFAYYLDLGLRGWADSDNNERVHALELARYVELSVQRWAVLNRGSQQKPTVLTSTGKDFELVLAKKSKREIPELPAAPPYPDWLKDGWKQRKQWQEQKRYSEAPLAYREFEASLLRAEQQWWGGRNRPETEFALARERLTAQLDEAGKIAHPPLRPRPVSLAQLHRTVDPALYKELDDTVGKIRKIEKPEDREKLRLDWYKKEIEKGKTLDYEQFALLAWSLVVNSENSNAKYRPGVVWLNELLTNFPKPDHSVYVETILITRLTRLKRTDETWLEQDFVEARNLVIRLVDQSEKLLALDPTALQWHQTKVDGLGATLRTQQELFFGSDWNKAALSELVSDYKKLLDEAEILQRGRDKFDEACVVLPAALPYLTRADSKKEEAWDNALAACKSLHKELDLTKPEQSPDSTVVKSQTIKLSASLEALQQPVSGTAIDTLVKEVPNTPPTGYANMQLRFASPALELDKRLTLLQGMRTLSNRFQGKMETEDRQPPLTATPGGESLASMTAAAQDRRARLVIDLLILVGMNLQDLRTAQSIDPLRLQESWAKTLPKMVNDAPTLAEKQWLMTAVHPFARLDVNPAAERLRLIRARHWEWLGRYYEASSKFYAPRKALKDLEEFYDTAWKDFELRARAAKSR